MLSKPLSGTMWFLWAALGVLSLCASAVRAQSSISANGVSASPTISADGTKIAFVSNAPNLVAANIGNERQVYVRDLTTDTTILVSANDAGEVANDVSDSPSISADGSKVAFVSSATNLLANSIQRDFNVYVCDLKQGTTRLVSVNKSGQASGGVDFTNPSISADGSRIAFMSHSSDLVANDRNHAPDIFVRDLKMRATVLVSATPSGATGNGGSLDLSISADGNRVAFSSYSSDLVANDTNDNSDIFVRDLTRNTTVLASANRAGGVGNSRSASPSLSSDGNRVAFESQASDLTANKTDDLNQVFVRDLKTSTTALVSANLTNTRSASGGAYSSSVNRDGSFVSFVSYSSDLVANDLNGTNAVFVRNVKTQTTTLISTTATGKAGNGLSSSSSISGDGSRIAFQSAASDLVAGDTNRQGDIFVRDLKTNTTTLVSVAMAIDDAYNLLIVDSRNIFGGPPPQQPQKDVTFQTNGIFRIDAPGVLANDNVSGGGPLTASLASYPQHGRFQLRSNGAFYYLPNNSFVGRDEFTYTFSDGKNQTLARVRLNIVDQRAPELTFDTPANRARVKNVSKIAGRVRDRNSGADYLTLFWKRFDGAYWNGNEWAETPTILPLRVQGINWDYAGQLPGPGTDRVHSLVDGSYELTVQARDVSGNGKAIRHQILVENAPPIASAVRLSSASASAPPGTIVLNFTGALDAATANNRDNYRISVNGTPVFTNTAIYTENSVTLSNHLFYAGNKLTLQVGNLRDASGKTIAGGTIQLVAR